MGFFNNFSTIGKIYDKLSIIEDDLTQMQRCLQNTHLRSEFNAVSSQGIKHLKELISIVNNAGDTVMRADFDFAGQKKPIAHHIHAISEYMK